MTGNNKQQKETIEQRMKLPWEGFNAKQRSDETSTENTEESLTQQSMAQQADINWIVRNFMPTAIPTNVRVPMEGDFTGITDYRTAIANIRAAEESFARMPAELRKKLDNDPQRFIDWCADPKNLEEMRKIGLAVPKPAEPNAAGSTETKKSQGTTPAAAG